MWFFIIIIIVFVIVLAILARKKSGTEIKLPYAKKDYFLTRAEVDFLKALEKATENKYYIFPQVSLSDLLLVKAKKGEYYKYRNKIDRKSVEKPFKDAGVNLLRINYKREYNIQDISIAIYNIINGSKEISDKNEG